MGNISDTALMEITEEFGDCASWAMWASDAEGSRSGMGDISIFDFARHPENRDAIRADSIVYALNYSRRRRPR